jgi:hypothetical protein
LAAAVSGSTNVPCGLTLGRVDGFRLRIGAL